jgi:hypothetical protein
LEFDLKKTNYFGDSSINYKGYFKETLLIYYIVKKVVVGNFLNCSIRAIYVISVYTAKKKKQQWISRPYPGGGGTEFEAQIKFLSDSKRRNKNAYKQTFDVFVLSFFLYFPRKKKYTGYALGGYIELF